MKVQELLTTDNWIQTCLAADKGFNSINPDNPEACYWCLLGAVYKCYINDFKYIRSRLHDKIGSSIIVWNDDPRRIWEEVEALIKELDI